MIRRESAVLSEEPVELVKKSMKARMRSNVLKYIAVIAVSAIVLTALLSALTINKGAITDFEKRSIKSDCSASFTRNVISALADVVVAASALSADVAKYPPGAEREAIAGPDLVKLNTNTEILKKTRQSQSQWVVDNRPLPCPAKPLPAPDLIQPEGA